MLVGVLYRPPDQSDFLDQFTEALSNLHTVDEQEVYILGDMNTNSNQNLYRNLFYSQAKTIN